MALASATILAYYVLTTGATKAALSLVARPAVLTAVAVVFVVGGILWCASIILTAVQARPARLDRGRTRLLAAITTVLVFVVAVSSFKVAEYATITQSTVAKVFGTTPVKPGEGAQVAQGEDPWAKQARVNILLIGSDAGADRIGTRSDSMIVASIDTKSGRTALISLPRNLQNVPLAKDSPLRRAWPSGVYGQPVCPRQQADPNDPCQLNALWADADLYNQSHPGAYNERVPGRTETRNSIAEILGLKIDQTVVIDLKGFAELVDAMGGVTINVKNAATGMPLPIGGSRDANNNLKPGSVKGYFKPGVQKLNGYYALWYARSRAGDDDTHRQMRQRCVIQAIVKQVNPAQMLGAYPRIASILQSNIYTDIPGQNLPAFVTLVERVQKSNIATLGLTQNVGIKPWDPDLDLIRRLVKKAISPPAAKPRPTSTAGTAPSSPTRTQRPTPSPSTTPYEQC
ncbi:LCP family protein [Terrabacter sp. AAH1]